MAQLRIETLTPEQEALIPAYRENWRRIALFTERIERQKATEAVKVAYELIGEKEPAILFCHSPYEAFKIIFSQMQTHLGNLGESTFGSPLGSRLESQILSTLQSQVDSQVKSEFLNQLQINLDGQLGSLLGSELASQLEFEFLCIILSTMGSQAASEIGKQLPLVEPVLELLVKIGYFWTYFIGTPTWKIQKYLATLLAQIFHIGWDKSFSRMGSAMLGRKGESDTNNVITPEVWAGYGSYIDFCVAVLNCNCDQIKWEAFQSLIKHCGWIFPFENICIVCDRPIKLAFDSESRLHAEGEPAVQFADGFSVYAHHGELVSAD